MVKRLLPLLLFILLGETNCSPPPAAPVTTTTAKASSEATAPVDLYALSPDEFFERPETQARIRINFVDRPLAEAAIFQQSNRQRVANKLPPFTHSWALQRMARDHSKEMSDLQYFDHESPISANQTLVNRLKNVGLFNVAAAENLAVLPTKEMGSGSYVIAANSDGTETWTDQVTGKRIDYYTYAELAAAVVTHWLNSPTHRESLLDKDKGYTYLGIGLERGRYSPKRQDSFYMTQNFASALNDASETKAQEQLNQPAAAPK